tara:strand:+ start:41 stop:661 length:621 start_codon:yes stop_codon:yes gene_type:complete
MQTKDWFSDPTLLLDKEYIMEVIPNYEWNRNRNINALTRLIVFLTIIMSIVLQRISVPIIGVISIFLIFLIYKAPGISEGFELNDNNKAKIGWKNPFNNLLAGDGKEKKEAPFAFKNESEINESVIEMVKKTNPTHKNIDKKLFKDLGEKFELDRSMIPFNSAPSTLIPNNQGEFAYFLYGDMVSGKEGNKFKLMGRSNQLHYNAL